jgi:chemotaxis protein CheZ
MGAIQETEDLEALFDQVAAQRAAAPGKPEETAHRRPRESGEPDAANPLSTHDVYQRLGKLARELHNALRELGYEKCVEDAVKALPDTRERLAYIASLTGKAAERVLAGVERCKSAQEAMRTDSAALGARWEKLFEGGLALDEFKALAADTRAHFAGYPGRAAATDRELTEIMLAQDFHDLTGQVIQRIVGVAQSLEEQLVRLLLDASPPERRGELKDGWLSGPVVSAAGRTDVVTSQGQVDELLESLGF